MREMPTKVLIVDDSALYRQSIQNVLRELSDVLVVGSASNGIEALRKIEQLAPDLLTLDVQMPDMDGIRLLQEIRRRRLPTKAIMVSSFTSDGATVTTEALLEGAFDFVLKPVGNDASRNRQNLKDTLDQKIRAYRYSRSVRTPSKGSTGSYESNESKSLLDAGLVSKCRAVLIGTSTGGPETLRQILPKLPGDFPVPVFVVQHMPPKYTHSLAQRLNGLCQMDVFEGEHGAVAQPGQIILAPGGRHMGLQINSGPLTIAIADDPPELAVRPSVNYLFRSATQTLEGHALAVVLTGMGKDGAAGCQQLKEKGGSVFAQSRDDSIVFGMPKAVIDAGLADRILTIPRMAPAIVRHLKNSQRSQATKRHE
jgi:two-component system chemotaxis response regulator CheB